MVVDFGNRSLTLSKPLLPGPVFTKGLSQGLGLNVQYKNIKFKPKPWLNAFVNTNLTNTSLTEPKLYNSDSKNFEDVYLILGRI